MEIWETEGKRDEKPKLTDQIPILYQVLLEI